MNDRKTLHELLSKVLGSNNVYFQPPEKYMMKYPCIVYELDRIQTKKASNRLYKTNRKYTATIIDKNPDSVLPDAMLEFLPLCSHSRTFKSENLYHYVFTIYY